MNNNTNSTIIHTSSLRPIDIKDDILPNIITQDLFPYVYNIGNLSDNSIAIFDENYDTFPFPYKYNPLPNTVQYYYNPMCIDEEKKIYEQIYSRNNIHVNIQGSYEDLKSVFAILNTYIPIKSGQTNQTNHLIPLASNTLNMQKIGVIRSDDDKILIKMNDKLYSGSGICFMVIGKTKTLYDSQFVLFHDVKNNQYSELGGKIDKQNIDDNILFNNATKEASEESFNLFNVTIESKYFIDIESETSKTYYRVYLCAFECDIDIIKNHYMNNKFELINDQSINNNPALYETDNIAFFNYKIFSDKLNYYDSNMYYRSNGYFTTINGELLNVRGRTMRAISSLIQNNIIDNMFLESKFNKINITKKNNVTSFVIN